jgi:NADH-quinone oxidoreductase subunit I
MARVIIPLLKGLRLTLKRFFSRSVTIQYPEQKKPMPPRWRGMHYFDKNEKGETTCVACGLCVAICPSRCITLEIGEKEDGTRYPMRYEIDALRCIFCGYCQEACPVNAIRLGAGYEFVQYRREDFKLNKEKLLGMYGAMYEVKK